MVVLLRQLQRKRKWNDKIGENSKILWPLLQRNLLYHSYSLGIHRYERLKFLAPISSWKWWHKKSLWKLSVSCLAQRLKRLLPWDDGLPPTHAFSSFEWSRSPRLHGNDATSRRDLILIRLQFYDEHDTLWCSSHVLAWHCWYFYTNCQMLVRNYLYHCDLIQCSRNDSYMVLHSHPDPPLHYLCLLDLTARHFPRHGLLHSELPQYPSMHIVCAARVLVRPTHQDYLKVCDGWKVIRAKWVLGTEIRRECRQEEQLN